MFSCSCLPFLFSCVCMLWCEFSFSFNKVYFLCEFIYSFKLSVWFQFQFLALHPQPTATLEILFGLHFDRRFIHVLCILIVQCSNAIKLLNVSLWITRCNENSGQYATELWSSSDYFQWICMASFIKSFVYLFTVFVVVNDTKKKLGLIGLCSVNNQFRE